MNVSEMVWAALPTTPKALVDVDGSEGDLNSRTEVDRYLGNAGIGKRNRTRVKGNGRRANADILYF